VSALCHQKQIFSVTIPRRARPSACFGLGLYAMKSSIAPAIMSELTKLRCLGIGAW